MKFIVCYIVCSFGQTSNRKTVAVLVVVPAADVVIVVVVSSGI